MKLLELGAVLVLACSRIAAQIVYMPTPLPTPVPLSACTHKASICLSDSERSIGSWQTCDMCVCDNLAALVNGTHSLNCPQDFYSCQIRQMNHKLYSQTSAYARCVPTTGYIVVCIFSTILFASGMVLVCSFFGLFVCFSRLRRQPSMCERILLIDTSYAEQHPQSISHPMVEAVSPETKPM